LNNDQNHNTGRGTTNSFHNKQLYHVNKPVKIKEKQLGALFFYQNLLGMSNLPFLVNKAFPRDDLFFVVWVTGLLRLVFSYESYINMSYVT